MTMGFWVTAITITAVAALITYLLGIRNERRRQDAQRGKDYAATRKRMDAVDADDDGFVPAELRDWLRKRGERGRNL